MYGKCHPCGTRIDKVRNEVGLAEINTTAAREHVVKIERMIQVIK